MEDKSSVHKKNIYRRSGAGNINAEKGYQPKNEKFLEKHVTIDFLTGDIWLDVTALYYYEDVFNLK